MRNSASVRAAIAGHDAMSSAIDPPCRLARSLYSEGARVLSSAMEGSGIGQMLVLSSAGVRPDDSHLALWYRCIARASMNDLYDDMRLAESLFRLSPINWTFVRATRLEDTPPTGIYRVLDGATPNDGWMVSRTELVRFIRHELDEYRWFRVPPTVAQ